MLEFDRDEELSGEVVGTVCTDFATAVYLKKQTNVLLKRNSIVH